MLCHLLAVAVLHACGPAVYAQCWERAQCKDLSSPDTILECLQMCRPEWELSESSQSSSEEEAEEVDKEKMVALRLLMSALVQAEPAQGNTPVPSSTPGPVGHGAARRAYVMEHFRWGKPIGRKRRPVKVYNSGVPKETQDGEDGRADSGEAVPLVQNLGEVDTETVMQSQHPRSVQKDIKVIPTITYRINHFRWNRPSAGKRYGGFMRPWSDQSQKPLLTLLRNVIIKDGQ
ncbi:pro-opiomelanocortin-2-like [Denticeps clupeoides]|uniref:Corticotropin n=1 Tax=Denticeps clupeoides TaxID=299321 RepID=A0AAY4B2D5_9TELE|nr:pro-opiomelanocortin-2-like [Denticeps clupeoides]